MFQGVDSHKPAFVCRDDRNVDKDGGGQLSKAPMTRPAKPAFATIDRDRTTPSAVCLIASQDRSSANDGTAHAMFQRGSEPSAGSPRQRQLEMVPLRDVPTLLSRLGAEAFLVAEPSRSGLAIT